MSTTFEKLSAQRRGSNILKEYNQENLGNLKFEEQEERDQEKITRLFPEEDPVAILREIKEEERKERSRSNLNLDQVIEEEELKRVPKKRVSLIRPEEVKRKLELQERRQENGKNLLIVGSVMTIFVGGVLLFRRFFL